MLRRGEIALKRGEIVVVFHSLPNGGSFETPTKSSKNKQSVKRRKQRNQTGVIFRSENKLAHNPNQNNLGNSLSLVAELISHMH